MNQRRDIETDACLLIFDPHQDLEWLEGVIEQERERVSHILLGGDYFDCYQSHRHVSVRRMARYLRELDAEWGDRLTVLLGNHDVHYAEAQRWSAQRTRPGDLRYQCSGFSRSKSEEIAKELDASFWRACRLFQRVNGWLVSHAGVAGAYWYPEMLPEEALEALEQQCQIALEHLPFADFALLHAGQSRGGDRAIGGITWQDFNWEFSDRDIPFRQIVGHTVSANGARRKGRSWCLDGGQRCHGVLHRDGELEIVGPMAQTLPDL